MCLLCLLPWLTQCENVNITFSPSPMSFLTCWYQGWDKTVPQTSLTFVWLSHWAGRKGVWPPAVSNYTGSSEMTNKSICNYFICKVRPGNGLNFTLNDTIGRVKELEHKCVWENKTQISLGKQQISSQEADGGDMKGGETHQEIACYCCRQ